MPKTEVNRGENARPSAPQPAATGAKKRPSDTERRALRFAALALALISLWLLRSLWVPLILASWFALLARPAKLWFAKRMGGHRRAASLVTFLLVTIALAPLAMTVLSLAGDAGELVRQVVASADARQALEKVVAAPNQSGPSAAESLSLQPDRLLELARRHGMGAVGTLSRIAGALTTAIIGVVVFVYGFYVFLQNSPEVHRWMRDRAPLRPPDFERLAGAYAETGRGLLLGVGLTAVLQGAVATIGYVIVGIPHALVLGLMTMIAALLPAIGSALVWVPVAAALALANRPVAAGIIVGIGLFIGVVDNFVRPALSRYGKLRLPVFVLFVAMLGGLAAFGGWGVILGPLVVRLAVEAFDIMRDQIRYERRDLTPAAGH